MKPTYYLFILLSGISLSVFSQSMVQYTYDKAGNRLSRTIFMLRSATVAGHEEEKEETNPQEIVYSDKIAQSNIRIYPNPTKGILKVEIIRMEEEKPVTIQLYNMAGQLLIEKPDVIFSTDIDISNRPAGTYLLKIVSGDNVVTWKIIKQ